MTEQTYPIGCVVNYEWRTGDKGIGYVSFETNEFPGEIPMDEAKTVSGIYDSEILYYHDTYETVAENFWDFIKTKPFDLGYNELIVKSIVSFTFAPAVVG